MYVIHINDRPLTLRATPSPRTRGSAHHLTARYNGKPRTLLNYVDMLEKGSPKVTSVDIVAPNLEQLWQDFRGHYKWVAAAGGVVVHAGSAEILFIFRRGHWDLPKGKIDPGEDEPTAALREVREETGLTSLTLQEQLPTTFHTYRNRKDKRVLKPTYWFRMATEQRALTPQAEEDIERAEWRTIEEITALDEPMYSSLRSLLEDNQHF